MSSTEMLKKLVRFQSSIAYEEWKLLNYGSEPVAPTDGTKEEWKKYKSDYKRWEKQFMITKFERNMFEWGYREGMSDASRAFRGKYELPTELLLWLRGVEPGAMEKVDNGE